MTVAELIAELEKIEDKTLDVVADIGLDSWEQQEAEVIDTVYEIDEYYGTFEDGHWVRRTRKCIKLAE